MTSDDKLSVRLTYNWHNTPPIVKTMDIDIDIDIDNYMLIFIRHYLRSDTVKKHMVAMKYRLEVNENSPQKLPRVN